MEFFDANIRIGRTTKGSYKPAETAADLIQIMDDLGIAKALVWHVAQHDWHPQPGNDLVNKAIEGEDRLFGCWAIMPPQTGEVIDDYFFPSMKHNGIYALRAFPDFHQYLLNTVTFGAFLEEITHRHIPLMLSVSPNSGDGVKWANIHKIMEDFPDLTCVLCDTGVWGTDRFSWPLLEAFPNLYIETSLVSLEAGGVEAIVERYGADRLLFGTGFPDRYIESPMLQLLHAEISDADKQKIASSNLEELIGRIRL